MYLLDTNHCIHLINGDTELLQRLEKVADEDAGVATSIIVCGELEFGAANSERRNENTRKVSSFLDDIDVVSVDRQTATIYGDLKAKLAVRFGPKERSRRTKFDLRSIGISDNDLWIAATVLREHLIVISDDSDFDRIAEIDSRMRRENWLEAQS